MNGNDSTNRMFCNDAAVLHVKSRCNILKESWDAGLEGAGMQKLPFTACGFI